MCFNSRVGARMRYVCRGPAISMWVCSVAPPFPHHNKKKGFSLLTRLTSSFGHFIWASLFHLVFLCSCTAKKRRKKPNCWLLRDTIEYKHKTCYTHANGFVFAFDFILVSIRFSKRTPILRIKTRTIIGIPAIKFALFGLFVSFVVDVARAHARSFSLIDFKQFTSSIDVFIARSMLSADMKFSLAKTTCATSQSGFTNVFAQYRKKIFFFRISTLSQPSNSIMTTHCSTFFFLHLNLSLHVNEE